MTWRGRKITSAFKQVSQYYLLIAVCLLCISTFLNAVLAFQLRAANTKIRKNETESNQYTGEIIPPVEALSLDGKPTTITFSDGRPTVIYVFSPTCSWCEKNLDNIGVLYNSKSSDYRFIGISVNNDGLEEYVSRHNWNFPVLKDVTNAGRSSLKLGGTPQTIVLSGNGEVMRSWRGAYMSQIKDDVEGYFGIRMPGIRGQ